MEGPQGAHPVYQTCLPAPINQYKQQRLPWTHTEKTKSNILKASEHNFLWSPTEIKAYKYFQDLTINQEMKTALAWFFWFLKYLERKRPILPITNEGLGYESVIKLFVLLFFYPANREWRPGMWVYGNVIMHSPNLSLVHNKSHSTTAGK